VLLGWGVAGIFDKKAVERSGSFSTFLTFHLFNIPVFFALLIVLPMLYGTVHLNYQVVAWEVLNAVCAMAALVTYYQAMKVTQASWVLGITAGYPIIGQLIACLALGEPFSWMTLFAAVAISCGVAAIGRSETPEQKSFSKRDKMKLFFWVAFSTVLWGLLGVIDKKAVFYARPLEAYLAFSAAKAFFAVVLVAFLARGQIAVDMKSPRLWKFAWLSALFLEAGNIGFLLALPSSEAGYLIVVTACYPLVMYVCAVAFLKERVNLLRVGGIVLIISGLLLANLPIT